MFNYTDSNGDIRVGKVFAHIVGAIILLVLIVGSFVIVPAGYIGVHTRFGAVVGEYQPGFHLKVPIIDNSINMNVQVQKDQSDAQAASNDLQEVTATVAVNYHINPQDASTVFQNIGANYKSTVIAPAIQESVKSVTANYTAEELITKRENVVSDINKLLSTKLQNYGIQMDSLNIVNFAFSKQFNSAVEAKVTAEQDALTAQNQIAQAKAEASSTIIAAEASAKAIKIQAEAIQNAGGQSYVELQAIKAWDGKMPSYLGSGSNLLFSIPAK